MMRRVLFGIAPAAVTYNASFASDSPPPSAGQARQIEALVERDRANGLTLNLNFDDGAVSERTLFAAGSDTPRGLISIDKDVDARRQSRQ